VSDDRTVQPSAVRVRRGWQAGLRPRSRWWLAAVAWLLAAGVAAQLSGAALADLVGLGDLRAAIADPDPARALSRVVAGAIALAGTVVVVVIAVGVVVGSVGPVSARERARLSAPAPTSSPGVGLVGVVAGLGLAAALAGAVAGAARAPAASEAGLFALWIAWGPRLAATIAAALLLAGAIEWLLSRRSVVAALRQSPQEARAEQRSAGGHAR
jgi:hypothetical protein